MGILDASSLKSHQNDQGDGAYYMCGETREKAFPHENGEALEEVAGEVVEPFKTCLDTALSNLLLLALF